MPPTSFYPDWPCRLHHSTQTDHAPYIILPRLTMPPTSFYPDWPCPLHHSTQTDHAAYIILPRLTMPPTSFYPDWPCPLHHSTQTDHAPYIILPRLTMPPTSFYPDCPCPLYHLDMCTYRERAVQRPRLPCRACGACCWRRAGGDWVDAGGRRPRAWRRTSAPRRAASAGGGRSPTPHARAPRTIDPTSDEEEHRVIINKDIKVVLIEWKINISYDLYQKCGVSKRIGPLNFTRIGASWFRVNISMSAFILDEVLHFHSFDFHQIAASTEEFECCHGGFSKVGKLDISTDWLLDYGYVFMSLFYMLIKQICSVIVLFVICCTFWFFFFWYVIIILGYHDHVGMVISLYLRHTNAV